MALRRKLLIVFLALSLAIALCACSESGPPDPAQPGPYQVGEIAGIKVFDPSRQNRNVSVRLWYPAIVPEESAGNPPIDLEADTSGAPYPVIVMSSKVGRIFGTHLATHGYVIVGVDFQDSMPNWGIWLIDFPVDQAFALEQVIASPPAGLEGMLDDEKAGAAGYSFDGYDALALSGARIDPEYYKSKCQTAIPESPEPEAWWIDYICNMSGGWETFEERAANLSAGSDDGLWQPITSPLIKAVVTMAPEGAWLFGPRGLAAADRPALIVDGTKDDINYYNLEAVTIFEQLGSEEKTLISFIDQDHFMIFNQEQVSLMKMLMTAFFGYHLKGEQEYLPYFSKAYINDQPGLAWGVYP